MKLKLLCCLTVLVATFAAGNVYSDVEFGGNVDWNKFQFANDGDLALGGRVGFGLAGMMAVTSFDYYFTNADRIFNDQNFIASRDLNMKFWELNENLTYTIPVTG